MAITNKAAILAALCPPLDNRLAEQLIDEFISLERRYVLREWEPATLDGGQFAEAAARILYHQDSNILNRRKGVNECLQYVEDPNNTNLHHYPERKSAVHTTRLIRTIYKFRSDRGAVHIDPDYTANHLDSKLIVENCRWVLSELLRMFWTADRRLVAAAIREIVQYDIPAVGVFDGRPFVQRADCTAEEEILILLHHAAERGMTRTEIGQSALCNPTSVTRVLSRLTSPQVRQVIKLAGNTYKLTGLGIRRVLNELAEKLI